MFRFRPAFATCLVALVACLFSGQASAFVDLRVQSCGPSDSCGGTPGDGLLDPGEEGNFKVLLQNFGDELATGVEVNLSTMTPGVTVTVSNSRYPDLAPGADSVGIPDLVISVSPNVPCGTMITLTVEVVSDQATYFTTCLVQIPINCTPCLPPSGALLQVQNSAAVADTCPAGGGGSGNSIPEPGEAVILDIVARNAGPGDASNIVGTVTTATPGVTITQPMARWPDLAGFSLPASSLTDIEFTVDQSVPCGTIISFEVQFSYTTLSGPETVSDIFTVTIPVACTPCPAVMFTLTGCGPQDLCQFGGPGNANGLAEPGEDIRVKLVLTNSGTLDATMIDATVTSMTPGVRINVPGARFPDIAAGGMGGSITDIEFSLDASVPCGTVIVLDIAITTAEGSFMLTCLIPVPDPCVRCQPMTSPTLVLATCGVATDTCALGNPPNGIAEPGESVTLQVAVQNVGVQDATGVMATFSTATPGVTLTQATTAFPDLPAGGAPSNGVPAIAFTIDASVACGTEIVFTVTIASDQGAFGDTCRITIPTPCTPCSDVAVLSVAACVHQDTCPFGGPGSANGVVDPGELVSLTMTLTNGGMMAATGVTAVVTSVTPGIIITQPNLGFPMIPGGGSAPNNGAGVSYSVGAAVPCGTNLVFDIAITSDQGPFGGSCQVMVPANCTPCAMASGVSIGFVSQAVVSDTCAQGGPGNMNGSIDPGETITLNATVTNSGLALISNVVGTLASLTPGVTVTTAMASFGDIAAAANATSLTPFAFTVDPVTVGCGDAISLRLSFTSDQGAAGPIDVTGVAVPAPCDPCVTGVLPPGEVPYILPHCTPADLFEIEWQAAPRAVVYAFYQGMIDSLRPTGYDHACAVGQIPPPLLTTLPTATCGDGLDLYFLVVGVNAAGEGPYGSDSMGAAHPAAPVLCP